MNTAITGNRGYCWNFPDWLGHEYLGPRHSLCWSGYDQRMSSLFKDTQGNFFNKIGRRAEFACSYSFTTF